MEGLEMELERTGGYCRQTAGLTAAQPWSAARCWGLWV